MSKSSIFTPLEINVIKRTKILKAFEKMPEGSTMTYAALSAKIGSDLVNNGNDPQFKWAAKKGPESDVVVRHVYGTDSFKRLTKEEIAQSTDRARRIKNQAKTGLDEVSVAMKSNDKNVQAVAQAKAARFSIIRDMAPTSNRKVISDKI